MINPVLGISAVIKMTTPKAGPTATLDKTIVAGLPQEQQGRPRFLEFPMSGFGVS
jgi:hypothetical protein